MKKGAYLVVVSDASFVGANDDLVVIGEGGLVKNSSVNVETGVREVVRETECKFPRVLTEEGCKGDDGVVEGLAMDFGKGEVRIVHEFGVFAHRFKLAGITNEEDGDVVRNEVFVDVKRNHG